MPKNVVLPPQDDGRTNRPHAQPQMQTQRPSQPKATKIKLATRDPRRKSG
jgi:hypothetical protein